MTSLWALRVYLRGSWGLLLAALAVMGVAAAGTAYTVSMVADVFGPIFQTLTRDTMAELYRSAALFILVATGTAIASAGGIYLGDMVGQRILVQLRRAVFDHLMSLSLAFFEHRRSGELISRVNNDTTVLQRALGTDLSKVVVAPLAIVFMVAMMLRVSWTLTLAIGITVPLVGVIAWALGKHARRYAQRTQARVADLTASTQEAFSTVRVIKTFGLEERMRGRFASAALAVLAAEMRSALVKAVGFPVVFSLVALATCLTLVLGGYEILHGRLEGGATGLMKFLFLLQGAGAEVNSVARLWVVLQQAEAAARRTLDLLAESATVADAPDAVELEQVDGRVTFDNVDFAYDGSNRVLEGVSVDIRPGEVVALAGRSGAGKTTIANLVPRLYDVQNGAVLVDGLDVRRVKQASLKRFMGMVPQETILFSTSVRENIGFGREGATEEEIIAAAQAANAHDFIMALPEGYDTQVGERGTRLSGGQRQRIAIARAFLRNPRILILDEATSSLDTESEKAIHASLKSLLQGRTALIIAHRLSTIRDADRIVVVDGGRICEQGTHDSLLAQGGLYRRLYESRELALDEPAAAEDGVAGPGVPA